MEGKRQSVSDYSTEESNLFWNENDIEYKKEHQQEGNGEKGKSIHRKGFFMRKPDFY